MTSSSYNEPNFPHKLLLGDTQISRFCKAFANNSSTNIKFSKTQLSKIVLLRKFIGRFLVPLLKTGLPLMKRYLNR